MTTFTKKSFTTPDELATPAVDIMVETIKIGKMNIQKITALPGWSWSKSLKPIQKTESCQKHHLVYIISGRLGSRMNNRTELEFGTGEVGNIPPGHDGWTVGNEAAVWLELPH